MSQENQQSPKSSAHPITQMSFEESLKELETIVKKLESGQGTLEAAIEYYERGNHLKAHCDKKLREARLKVDTIIKDASDTLTLAPQEKSNV